MVATHVGWILAKSFWLPIAAVGGAVGAWAVVVDSVVVDSLFVRVCVLNPFLGERMRGPHRLTWLLSLDDEPERVVLVGLFYDDDVVVEN